MLFSFVLQTERGTGFRRSHHMVSKTTLYDMSVDPTCKYAAVGCQDRCIRWARGNVRACFWKVRWVVVERHFDVFFFFSPLTSDSFRIFNISSGKQKKLYKGSLSEDGSLLRVTSSSALLKPFLLTCRINSVCLTWILFFFFHPGRFSSIRRVSTWPPAAPTKTSASLTSTPGSVSPLCLDTPVSERLTCTVIYLYVFGELLLI